MEKPLILEIKGNSLDDGPGIRTMVFFKGCPLKCAWCHNPESKKIKAELSFDKSECIGCNKCIDTCKNGALSRENKNFIDRTKCTKCFECANVCPSLALSKVGTTYTIDELMSKILPDKPFFDVSGGGVTVSGGEATLYPEYVGELLKECKKNGINTLLETCGMFNFEKIEKNILPYIDTIFFDLKIADPIIHKKYCGIENFTIKENFKKLLELKGKYDFKLLPRTPLIPNITDTKENLEQIAEFLKNLGVNKSELLPYNPTWVKKNDKLGIKNKVLELIGDKWQSKEKINFCKSIYINRGIRV